MYCISLFFMLVISVTMASRGRPSINSARSTFVSDRGTPLRGPRWSVDSKGALPHRSNVTQIKYQGGNVLHVYGESFADSKLVPGHYAHQIETLVNWTREDDLYMVLTIGNSNKNGEFNYTYTMGFWDIYAARFADETHVIYEIQNEPHKWSAPYPKDALKMERDAYVTIRKNAPETPVLFFSYSQLKNITHILSDIKGVGNVDWSNAGIAFHGYGYGDGDDIKNTLKKVIDHDYACVQTEFASNHFSTQDIPETKVFEKLEVSWLTFVQIPKYFETGPDSPFVGPIEKANISWVPDFGSWPQHARML